MGGWHQLLVVLLVDWGAAATDNFKRCRIEDDEERVQQKFGHNRGSLICFIRLSTVPKLTLRCAVHLLVRYLDSMYNSEESRQLNRCVT
ncbi:unnamed protein product [Toxocara canis]|uniref:Secreted protein n=1 Tax=Toxocara canis TaxID=6265 RepID=A0A183VGX6_TOXCA|nr:unnamed protein product [Toxocara canis]